MLSPFGDFSPKKKTSRLRAPGFTRVAVLLFSGTARVVLDPPPGNRPSRNGNAVTVTFTGRPVAGNAI